MNEKAKQAISKYGQAELGKEIEVDPAQVSHWMNDVRPVPVKHCLAIERALGGAATRKDLRPTDWKNIWPDLSAK